MKKTNEENKIPNIMDSKKNNYVMDPANVLLLAKAPDFIDCDGFECKEFGKMEPVDWRKVQSDMEKEKVFLSNTIVGYEYIEIFLKTIKAFTGNNKIKMTNMSVYQSTQKDMPIVIIYKNIMGILVPRVNMDGS